MTHEARDAGVWRVAVIDAADAPEAARLEAAAFADGWGEASLAEGLKTAGVEGLFAHSLDNGRACGYALWRGAGGEAEILTIGVAPTARRRGAARALVEAIADRAAAAGAAALFLEAAATNAAAVALYVSTGFEPVGRRPAYYRDGDDALLMRRSLRNDGEPAVAAPRRPVI